MFTKFHGDWIKIVDFLFMAIFWKCAVFLFQTLVEVEVHTVPQSEALTNTKVEL